MDNQISPMGWVTIIGILAILLSLIVDRIGYQTRNSRLKTLANVLTLGGFAFFIVGVLHYWLSS